MRVSEGFSAARLAAICCCAAFALLAVAGCTSGTPSVRATPSVGGSFYSGTAHLPGSGSSSAGAKSATATGSPARSAKSSRTPSAPSPSPAGPFPSAAPPTGGGGTAGFQHVMLLLLGAGAMLAGAGSLVYRRRLTRHR